MQTLFKRAVIAFVSVILITLSVSSVLAVATKTKKPAGCPTAVTQLTGCVKKVDAAKSMLTLDCNGIKHQVTVVKGATIILEGKAVALKNLKTGTKITAYGACASKGTVFQANRVCECATPRPKAKKAK